MTDTATRQADLRDMLNGLRREVEDAVQRRIRDGRTSRPAEVGDDLDQTDAGIREDIELALLQMKAETLTRIDAALVRLDAGEYGSCFECDDEIAERRLRALPFAVRCRACEERREEVQEHARQSVARRGSFSPFPEGAGA